MPCDFVFTDNQSINNINGEDGLPSIFECYGYDFAVDNFLFLLSYWQSKLYIIWNVEAKCVK